MSGEQCQAKRVDRVIKDKKKGQMTCPAALKAYSMETARGPACCLRGSVRERTPFS